MFSQGLKKVLSSCLRKEGSPSEHIIFCLPTKSFNEQTKTCSGQAKFKLLVPRASWNSSFEPCFMDAKPRIC